MQHEVQILIGTAGSGKTEHLLDRYRGALQSGQARHCPGTTLWLSPTIRSRRQILDQLLCKEMPVCFAPNVFTFEAFAETILKSLDEPIQTLPEISKRYLLRTIVDDFIAAGKIQYFSSIAGTTGFLDLVSSFISELKREEIWPEEFSEACGRLNSDSRQKDQELALIYDQYQIALHEMRRYDSEGRFWSARTALQEGLWGPFGQFDLVVLDGFADFTHTQYEILELLARRTGQLLISLPLEGELRRNDLFAKSVVAKRILESRLPGTIKTVCCTADGSQTSRRQISQSLFDNPRAIQPLPTAEQIKVLAVAGQRNEVDVLASEVKQLLLQGVLPEEITIAFRSTLEYGDLIEETLTAAGIPYFLGLEQEFSRFPVVRAIFAFLQIEIENWSFDSMMSILDSNYFSPDWPEYQEGAAVRCLSRVLRQLKIDSGKTDLLNALEKESLRARELCTRYPEQAKWESLRSETEAANQLARRLADATQRLRGKEQFVTWIEILISLANEFGLQKAWQGADTEQDQLDQRDQFVWERFQKLLFHTVSQIEQIEQFHQREAAPLDLIGFRGLLLDLLEQQTISLKPEETGRVRVLDAAQLRNLSIPYLLIGGLSEASFPRSHREDCLYSEKDRGELNQNGLSLKQHANQQQEEMLLFYEVMTRFSKQLILSYPAISSTGQPLFPSPYLTALIDLFEPAALSVQQVGELNPLPRPEQTLSNRDLRVLSTNLLKQGQTGIFLNMLNDPALKQTALNILAASEMAIARFECEGFTEYEGILVSPQNRQAIHERFPREYEFSTTQLELFLACPYQFFTQSVLGIDVPEPPELRTNHLQRGIHVHSILTKLYELLIQQGATDQFYAADQVQALFLDLLDQRVSDELAETKLQQVLLTIEKQILEDWGALFAEQSETYGRLFDELWDDPPSIVGREVPFGRVPTEPDPTQTHYGHLTLGSGEHETRVQGQIDRIDVGRMEGKKYFNIIDYKTGRALPSASEIRAGKKIQLALYLIAARRLEMIDIDAEPFHLGYWKVQETGFVMPLRSRKKMVEPISGEDLELLETTMEGLVPHLAHLIRDGIFPVQVDEKIAHLDPAFHSVCRFSQVESYRDSLGKQIDLLHGSETEEDRSEEGSPEK
ncbi:ATP-dependent helicase/deoxyribonuclease subunit B [Gimesia alba]|uniref:ATP-dependent helicase/deoxyribonuclease subunit B n=1 Tax=Gimesia alba TaxID=2527973 RepID=A0A517RDS9_9PLAN|nr:PD-(D/E)XK nuclease family protein [Gimesia alba]QDT42013.1 ATP-dependent helicase/deoxyribonuclease subunit B [Gimesia alba]